MAFVQGGQEAETKAREEWREEQKRKKVQEALHFRAWQLEQAEIRKLQRAEGKVFYREFTDEEKKEREEEAHRAWEEEQARLQKGVDKMKERRRDAADSGWTRLYVRKSLFPLN